MTAKREKESQENLEIFFREDAPELMTNFFIEGQKMLEAQNQQSNQ